MTFRPLLGVTLATLPALAILIALGLWQSGRAREKAAEIAAYEANLAAPAAGDPLCLPADQARGRTVEAPRAPVGGELRFLGYSREGVPGWRLLRLAPAPDCAPERGHYVVQVGFEPLDGPRQDAPAMLTLASPPRANFVSPENDPVRNQYHRFEPAELARGFGVEGAEIAADVWLIDAEPGPPPHLTDMPPARHVGYALTWFGLAATLVAVYIAFHLRAGRLGRSGGEGAP